MRIRRFRLASCLSAPTLAVGAVALFAAGMVQAQTVQYFSTPGTPIANAPGRIIKAGPPAGTLAIQARNAGIADGVSTGAALLAGGTELNPIGPVLAIAVKPLLLAYAKTQPPERQVAYFSAFSALWSGAAANNVCVTVSLLTGGSFTPACVAIGVAWGARTWNGTESERKPWQAVPRSATTEVAGAVGAPSPSAQVAGQPAAVF